jgi:hypothetical protein
MLSHKINNKLYFLPVLITLIFSSFIVMKFVRGPLQGEFNHIIFPAEKFGVPADLKIHGLNELFKGDYETGWDGQFYYYISNDLFAVKDTKSHIDSPSYRYQRIGLSFAAKCISMLLGQTWVSPFTYYSTHLFFILLATGLSAKFFSSHRKSPFLILLWSFGFGTQLTLLHGLPDAFADSMVIISLILLFYKKYILYLFSITLAIFSREIYFLIPATITFCVFLQTLMSVKRQKTKYLFAQVRNIVFLLTPCILFITYQLYLKHKFGAFASSQATGVLELPFKSAFEYLKYSLFNQHPILGSGKFSYLEAIAICLFLILTLFNLYLSIQYIRNNWHNFLNLKPIDFSLFSLVPLSIVYLCFGPTVMMLHTGYFKAANIFLFTIPFIYTITQKKIHNIGLIFLISTTIFFEQHMWYKIQSGPIVQTNLVSALKNPPPCLKTYKSEINIISQKILSPNNLFDLIFKSRKIILKIKLKNLTNEQFVPNLGQGGMTIGYHLISDKTMNGIATFLPKVLLPKQQTVLTINVPYPYYPKIKAISLSPVQLGCTWFDIQDSKNITHIKLS